MTTKTPMFNRTFCRNFLRDFLANIVLLDRDFPRIVDDYCFEYSEHLDQIQVGIIKKQFNTNITIKLICLYDEWHGYVYTTDDPEMQFVFQIKDTEALDFFHDELIKLPSTKSCYLNGI